MRAKSRLDPTDEAIMEHPALPTPTGPPIPSPFQALREVFLTVLLSHGCCSDAVKKHKCIKLYTFQEERLFCGPGWHCALIKYISADSTIHITVCNLRFGSQSRLTKDPNIRSSCQSALQVTLTVLCPVRVDMH